MHIDEKIAQLITLLIRETSSGGIEWNVVDPPRSLNHETEQSVPLFLQTVFKGKSLGVYDLRTKYYTDVDEYHWTEGVGFCIIDARQRVVWDTSEATPALLDLYTTAREQASGIDDILNDLLER